MLIGAFSKYSSSPTCLQRRRRYCANQRRLHINHLRSLVTRWAANGGCHNTENNIITERGEASGGNYFRYTRGWQWRRLPRIATSAHPPPQLGNNEQQLIGIPFKVFFVAESFYLEMSNKTWFRMHLAAKHRVKSPTFFNVTSIVEAFMNDLI